MLTSCSARRGAWCQAGRSVPLHSSKQLALAQPPLGAEAVPAPFPAGPEGGCVGARARDAWAQRDAGRARCLREPLQVLLEAEK